MAKRTPFEDDGRTIAPMDNVSRPSPFLGHPSSFPRTAEEARAKSRRPKIHDNDVPKENPPFSKKERRALVGGALASALLIGGVFIVVLGLAILVMDLFLNFL